MFFKLGTAYLLLVALVATTLAKPVSEKKGVVVDQEIVSDQTDKPSINLGNSDIALIKTPGTKFSPVNQEHAVHVDVPKKYSKVYKTEGRKRKKHGSGSKKKHVERKLVRKGIFYKFEV